MTSLVLVTVTRKLSLLSLLFLTLVQDRLYFWSAHPCTPDSKAEEVQASSVDVEALERKAENRAEERAWDVSATGPWLVGPLCLYVVRMNDTYVCMQNLYSTDVYMFSLLVHAELFFDVCHVSFVFAMMYAYSLYPRLERLCTTLVLAG